ncbi:MAG: hypothetical protein ACI9AU_001392 [Bacteroidia bacterium]|jgi:hypothetical protein
MKKSLLFIVLVLFLGSCIKDITDTIEKGQKLSGIQWNPTIAVPLVYSRLGLQDVLNEVQDLEYVRVEADGSLTLVYADEYESEIAENLLALIDQSYGETFTLDALQLNTLNTSGTLVLTYNRTLGYSFGANEIDKIWYKGGTLSLNISTTLEHDVAFKITIPEAKNNGTSLSETVSAIYTTTPNTGSSTIPLQDLEIDFTKTPQTYSEMDVELEITITKKGSNSLKPTETVTFDMQLLSQKYSKVTGLFDVLDFSTPGNSFDIGFFENSQSGTFTIADPRIKFILKNSIGIPIAASITRFEGTNTNNNKVSLSGLPDPLPIPIVPNSEMGTTQVDSFELNKNTSNLADYINNRPASNYYEMDVKTANTGSDRHFLLDSSKVSARLEIEIPLEGTAKDFVLESSQPFSLELENPDQVKEILVRLYTENGFPADIATQLYFEDSVSNTVLDSLIIGDILILPSANVDGNGKVNMINPKTTDIVMGTANVLRITAANRIRIKAYFNTLKENGGNQPDVKFYDSYDFLLQMGVQAEVLIDQDL